VSDFDPIKALREEISGMADLAGDVVRQSREAQAQMIEAEARYNRLVKLDAFMRDMLKRMHEKLQAMETALENVAKGG